MKPTAPGAVFGLDRLALAGRPAPGDGLAEDLASHATKCVARFEMSVRTRDVRAHARRGPLIRSASIQEPVRSPDRCRMNEGTFNTLAGGIKMMKLILRLKVNRDVCSVEVQKGGIFLCVNC